MSQFSFSKSIESSNESPASHRSSLIRKRNTSKDPVSLPPRHIVKPSKFSELVKPCSQNDIQKVTYSNISSLKLIQQGLTEAKELDHAKDFKSSKKKDRIERSSTSDSILSSNAHSTAKLSKQNDRIPSRDIIENINSDISSLQGSSASTSKTKQGSFKSSNVSTTKTKQGIKDLEQLLIEETVRLKLAEERSQRKQLAYERMANHLQNKIATTNKESEQVLETIKEVRSSLETLEWYATAPLEF